MFCIILGFILGILITIGTNHDEAKKCKTNVEKEV